MALLARQMQPDDVAECAKIIASHPVIGPRYGRTVRDLQSAWMRLLGSEGMTSVVIERVDGAQTGICFVGVSVFVNDDFARELKSSPSFWFGPVLAERVARGDSPVLSDKRLQEANARDGLTLVVWEGCVHRRFCEDTELPRFVVDVFIRDHRGFQLKEVISSQLESAERLKMTLKSGALLWDPQSGRYVESLRADAAEIAGKPHLVGLTRDIERRRRPWGASWVGALFDYHPPRFGFTRSEQHLLLLALAGKSGTDEELAASLGVSLPTIKKMWLSVYRRVADRGPRDESSDSRVDRSKRGKEKRRRLLAYLREHPEELRPVSRKHLREHSVGRRV